MGTVRHPFPPSSQAPRVRPFLSPMLLFVAALLAPLAMKIDNVTIGQWVCAAVGWLYGILVAAVGGLVFWKYKSHLFLWPGIALFLLLTLGFIVQFIFFEIGMGMMVFFVLCATVAFIAYYFLWARSHKEGIQQYMPSIPLAALSAVVCLILFIGLIL